MHVTKKYHRQVVSLLSAAVVALAVLLGVLIFGPYTSSDPDVTPTPMPYLHEQEIVVITPRSGTTSSEILKVEDVLFEYIEVTGSCGIHYEGECVNARSGPGEEYPAVKQLRDHIVLKVGGKVEREGRVWYKIVFDEFLRYPERVTSDWYVAADMVTVLYDEGDQTVWQETEDIAAKLQRIVVDVSEQKLYAYEDDVLFLETDISTGLEITPTPLGDFTIFKKTPSRYMQGPLPGLASDQYYDMPGVPWNLYFTHGGAVIHGAYWHDSFGRTYSHGCVNLPPEIARTLYNWAKLGTKVTVQD